MQSSRSQKFTLALFASLSIALLSVGVANAADRYAGVGGSGTECSQSARCSITTAINSASAGDFVIIAPGTYGSFTDPVLDIKATTNYVQIRGENPFARPMIYASNTAAGVAAFQTGQYTNIEDLDIVSVAGPTTYYGLLDTRGSVNRVSVSGSALSAVCGLYAHATNTSCSTTTPGISAIEATVGGSGSGAAVIEGYNFINVTAVATNGVGFTGGADTGMDVEFIVTNSIFRGSIDDINLMSNNVNGADVDADIRNSNFADVTTAGTGTTVTPSSAANNQTLAPQFVDIAGGNARPLANSPTVNAGDDSIAEGPYDAGGAARVIGGRVDIGAYEWSPPPPVVVPPTTTITGLKALTSKFASAKSGAAFQAANKRPKTKKGKPPVGTLITFTLSQADTVNFTLEKGTSGRKSGGKCVKKTKSNASKKKCTRYVAVKGTESVAGAAGKNTVWFTGRWGKKALPAGSSFVMRGTPIKASTGNEPGVLNPRPIKTFPK